MHDLGIGFDVERVGERHRDPQLAGVAAHRERVRLGRPRRPRRVARLVAGQHVEQQRGLGDRAREHAVRHQERVAEVGPARDAPAARLQADEPAAGGRDPQRPAAVARMRERDEAGRDRRRGAAGRAARRARRVPRVARGPGVARLGRRQDPELGHVRRADDHEARLAQPADEVRVVRRPVSREEARAEVHALPGHGDVRLDPDRHARERARVARLDRVRLGEHPLGVQLDERAELGVDRLDAPERGLDGLAGGERAVADSCGQLRCGQEGERVHHGCEHTTPIRAAVFGLSRRTLSA